MMQTTPRRRPGLTLIELLVIIGIILILAALTTSASIQVISSQQQKNSELTVKKVSEAVNQAWRAVIDQAKEEQVPASVLSMAGNDPRRARIIYIKLRLKQEFPMSFTDITTQGPGDLPPLPAYQAALGSYNPATSPWAAVDPLTGQTRSQTGACLYLSLKRNRRGVGFDVDTALSSKEVAEPFSDRIKEIVDSRGRPLGFYRWPYGNTDLNPGGPQSGQNDPEDIEGLLTSPNWTGSSGATTFQNLVHPVAANSSYKLKPVVVGTGKNGKLGLNPNSMAVTNANDANDNIYSFDLR